MTIQNNNENTNSYSHQYDYLQKKPGYVFSGIDTLFAWLSVIVGFFISRALPISENPLGNMIVILCLFVFGMVYLKLSKKEMKARCVILMAVSLVFSFGLINISNQTVKGFLYLFVLVCFLYWVYTSFTLEKVLGDKCLFRILKAVFAIPFSSIGFIFPGFVLRDKSNKGAKIFKNVLFIGLGLLCAIIPTSIVVSLLSYDSGFSALLKEIFYFTPEEVVDFIGDLILGLFFAMLLYGSLYGSRYSTVSTDSEEKGTLNVIPKAIICAAITPVLFVYAVFFISQWDYYVSAFTKVLPENLSYATYAREGFFQLCGVCVFNALMLLLFHSFVKTNGKKYDFVKVLYSSVISVFTLVLVATALSKMLLYIDSYGLTRLRVYSSWMIVLLAFFFIITLLYQFIPKIPLVSSLVVTFVVFFGIITLPNVDAIIAQYNVDAYISGELGDVDVSTLMEYGDSAVPALFELKDYLDSKETLSVTESRIYKVTNNTLCYIESQLFGEGDNSSESIFSFSIPEYKAKKLFDSHEELTPISLGEIS